jgi:hypothetical protein
MTIFKDRFQYLFYSTKGLTLVAIAMVAMVTALFGMLSGPMSEFGISKIVIDLFGFKLIEAEREGRIITLYHSIAMAVVAIETYFITSIVQMKHRQQLYINAIITAGYLFAMIGGLGFGYFGHNWFLHILFIAGMTLVFLAGTMLSIALWPWNKKYRVIDNEFAHTKKGTDVERIAFFTMALATLGSSLFGAIPGGYLGNGFEIFLAENTIRLVEKTMMQNAVVGHLHIMLTLISVAMTLVVGKWLKFKGILHKLAMPTMILGTIIISIGAWSVTVTKQAHSIIYGGSTFVMLAALLLVIFGLGDLIRIGLKKQGLKKASFGQRIKAILHDPIKFGPLWQMIFMNFTVSGIGLFMAAKLDDIFRVWPWEVERITLTGHWHILSGIIATIILLYYADLIGLKGKVRKWYGWLIIIFSDLAFLSMTIFSIKRLFVSEAAQQPVTDLTILLTDIGLGILLIILAILLVWRLIDLFKQKGIWVKELADAKVESDNQELI